MSKILTISVAAYNVEKTIRMTLDSCLLPEILDDIEILVENDGSTDHTSEIAHEYERKYPDTVRVIDKENGGYGSTVNRSIREASGKYFKLLDGDDWFEHDGIIRLVKFLKTCEADLVLSDRIFAREDGKVMEEANDKWLQVYSRKYGNAAAGIQNLKPFSFGMWYAAFRLELLRGKAWRDLPEHMLYTDSMFVLYPLAAVHTVAFQNYGVYCYRIGSEEQSVSASNRIRHLRELIRGYHIQLRYYQTVGKLERANDAFVVQRIAKNYVNVIFTILLCPASRRRQRQIMKLEQELKQTSGKIYDCSGNINRTLKAFRKFGYETYWLRKLIKVRNFI